MPNIHCMVVLGTYLYEKIKYENMLICEKLKFSGKFVKILVNLKDIILKNS